MAAFVPPKSYTAYAVTKKGGTLERMTVDWKEPKEGQVVVKVLACGVCASDEHVFEGHMGMQYPRVPGHEIVGTIAAIPPTEKHWKLGQRVGAGWHGGHCSFCTSCRAGDYMMCKKQEINGIRRDGGYAEYVTLEALALVGIPNDLEPAQAAPLLCAGVAMFNSLRHANVSQGDIVAIQGIGGLGHLGLQYARQMGFRTVALSSSDAKRELALQLGADVYIDGSKEDQGEALTRMGGAKVIACTAPNGEAIHGLVKGLKPNGQLLILGSMPDASLPLALILKNRLTITGWPAGVPQDCEDTVAFTVRRGIKAVVTTFPLENAQEAYEHRASARFRAVIVPQ